MDTLGKIFVFAVMVMSVVFMSFAIAIFSSHTNWQKESERLQTELEQATAERAAKESELTTLIDQNAASEKDQEQVVKKLETALQQKDAELAGRVFSEREQTSCVFFWYEHLEVDQVWSILTSMCGG